MPISAYVRDDNFIEKVRGHEIRFGNGDALEDGLEVYEELDEDRGIWRNDPLTYMIKGTSKNAIFAHRRFRIRLTIC